MANIKDYEKLELNNNLEIFKKSDQTVIVNPDRGTWVKVNEETYRVIKESDNNSIQGLLDYAKKNNLASDKKELLAFLEALLNAGFIYPKYAEKIPISTQARKKPRFFCAYLNITNRCNLKCPTCYIDAGNNHKAELSTEKIISGMEKLKSIGIQSLVISGGEPLIRKDLVEIAQKAKELFVEVTLLTNGTLINHKVASLLKRNFDRIQISIESADKETHEKIRGKNTFDKALEAIRLLKAEQAYVLVKPTITKINYHDMPRLVRLAKQLDVDIDIGIFFQVGRGACETNRLALNPKQLISAIIDLVDNLEKDEFFWRKFLTATSLLANRSCGAGKRILSVDSDGSVYPCHCLHYDELKIVNVMDLEIENLCQSPVLQRFENITVDNRDGCKNCDVRYFCAGGCIASIYSKDRSFAGTDSCCDFYRSFFGSLLWSSQNAASDQENLENFMTLLRSGTYAKS